MAEKNIQYEVGFSSHTGSVKELNEDNYCAERREDDDGHCSALVAISDGVGGFSLGEIASKIAINHVEKFFKLGEFKQMYEEAEILEPHRVVQELYTRINHVILSLAEKENRQVGCTLVSGFFNGDSVYVGSVGNSRAYLIRGSGLKRLTDEKVDPLASVELGKLTSDETLNLEGKTSYINSLGSDIALRADVKKLEAQEGDIFLFCSDGLYKQISEMEILAIAAENPTMQAFCNALVDKANFAGGKDNVTVVALRVSEEKRTLRSILATRKKGGSLFSRPMFVILVLLGIFFFLGTIFLARKMFFKPKSKGKLPATTQGSGRSPLYNSFTLKSKLPLKYLIINKESKFIEDEGTGTFEFETELNSIKIMPDLSKIKEGKKLYAVVVSGLNRNMSVIQARKNLVELERDQITVHLTAGSRVDFITRQEGEGERFFLKINNLGSPMMIDMKAEENIFTQVEKHKERGKPKEESKPAPAEGQPKPTQTQALPGERPPEPEPEPSIDPTHQDINM